MKIPGKANPTDYSTAPKSVTTTGKYHCVVLEVKEFETKNGSIGDRISLEVLAGTAPAEVGRRASATLFREKGEGEEQWGDGYTRWAWACGLLKPGQEIAFTPQKLIGKTLVAYIEYDENSRYANVGSRGSDVWFETHPDVVSVPKVAPAQGVRAESAQDSYDDLGF